MNTRITKFLKNIMYAVSANAARIVTTLLLTLLLPKLMSVEGYSYWQLYSFYGVYLAYSTLGWCDGTYIKYAGKDYKELDGNNIAAQFMGLCLYEAIFSIAVYFLAGQLIGEEKKMLAFGLAVLYNWIQIARFQLQTILQATNRIADYARVYTGERIINFLLVMLCMITGFRSFWVVAAMEVLSNLCMTIYAMILCKNVIFRRPEGFSRAFGETKELIGIGYKITLAGLASQIIIGIVRFGIEQKWGTIVFGKISLAFSMANMMLTCIAAVSIVLFPIFRKSSREKLQELFAPIRMCLTVPMYGILLFYIPGKLLMALWLPQYEESLRYLGILLPLCIYETRNMVLVWTYLKTIRREADIMKANLATAAVSLVTTGITVYVMESLAAAVISIVVLYAIKSVYTEYLLHKKMKIMRYRDLLSESVMTVIFIWSSWKMDNAMSVLVYFTAYVCYLISKRKALMDSIKTVKQLVTANEGGTR